MSRKSNNLRRRIRIANEQSASVLRDRQKLAAKLARLEREKADEDKSFARSVMIRVEREPTRFDTYCARLAFCPRAYLYYGLDARRDMMTNISYLAEYVGHQIGEMVTREILRQATEIGMTR